MITPTVGRVVWFWPGSWESGTDLVHRADQPLCASVAYVWNNRMVNLAVFDANGKAHSRTSVPLMQEGDPRPDSFFCEWMPYQKAVAKGEIAPTLHAPGAAHIATSSSEIAGC